MSARLYSKKALKCGTGSYAMTLQAVVRSRQEHRGEQANFRSSDSRKP